MPKPVFIPLAAGVQTELADQLVQPGATLVSENCASDQTGIARVRLGADILSTSSQATIPNAGTLPSVWQLAALDGSLVRFNRSPEPLHVWAPSPQAWVRNSPTSGGIISYRRGPVKVDTTTVFAQTQVAQNVRVPQVAVGTNAIVEVYDDTAAGVVVTILDRVTRKPLTTTRTAGGVTPRVIVVGNRAVVAYALGGNLQVDAYDLTSYTLAQQQTMGAIQVTATNGPIDIRVGAPGAASPNVGILYQDGATGNLKCAVLNSANLASNSTFTIRTTAGVVVTPNLAFGWLQDLGASGKFSVMIADTTNGLRTLWDLPAPGGGFSNATATHILDGGAVGAPSGSTPGIRNIIGTTTSNFATGNYRVLYEVTAPSLTTQAKIKVALVSGGATLGTDVQYRSIGLRSKFWQQSTNFYFLGAFDGATQRAYFVCAVANDLTFTATTPPAPLAVVFPRDAGGLTEFVNGVVDVSTGLDGAIYIGATSETRTESFSSAGTATGGTTREFAVEIIRVRHPSTVETEVGKPATFISSLFVPGGLLGHFDGSTFATAGFPYFPPSATAVIGAAGGNLTQSSNYAWRFVFSFTDRTGRKWRSAPTAAITGATDASKFKFTLTIETLRLIDRGLVSGTFGYQIEAYRTQANAPGAYFLVASIANDPLNDTVTFTDNVADTALGEELYTDGNGLENQLLPAVSNAVEYQGRLIVSESGRGTIWYSVEADFDHGLIFNEALTLDIGDPNDPITGLAVDGEHLFAFKEGKIYVVGGDGADALGRGATYNFRLIDSDTGCSNPQSIVSGAEGVWYRSSTARAGIFRTTGGNPEYVGAGVRAYNSLTITSAVVIKDKTEIRWYSLEGTTLIWNWTTNTWGVNTAQPCLSAVNGYNGVTGVVYARSTDGAILSEATVSSLFPYVEGGVNYLARVRSPWYRLGGVLGGFGRIKRVQGVGEQPSPHRALIALYRNMETSPFQTPTIVFDDSFRPRWDWEVRPAQQPMSVVMIEVTILPWQPPNETIAGNTLDRYDGIDPEIGGGDWFFTNGVFGPTDVGGTVTIAGGPAGKNGTYTITRVTDPQHVVMTPTPGGGTGAFGVVATITFTPPLQYTAGPGMMGVSLIPISKDGMDKLPAARRAA